MKTIIFVYLLALISRSMLKPTLIGLSLAILLDFATFSGAYTHKVSGESARLVYAIVTQDWHLTHH